MISVRWVMMSSTRMSTKERSEMKSKTLIVIVGPTGSGKSDVSIDVARHFEAEILSTDSRQFYREIPVGTAQPTPEQLSAVRHHFIADRSIHDDYNCGAYEVDALSRLEEIFSRCDTAVAVGGSGLYIDALCSGLDSLPEVDESLRRELRERAKSEGIEPLLEELRELDPEYYDKVDRANPSRVVRALEIIKTSGQPYSALRRNEAKSRPFRVVKVGIDMPREELYERINRRVELMLEAGLEAEARSVYEWRALNSLQTVGYREMFDYFDGEITLTEAKELIQRNSRRYAKRQMTWFRRDSSTLWIAAPQADLAISLLKERSFL